MFKNCILHGALLQGEWVGWRFFGLLLLLVYYSCLVYYHSMGGWLPFLWFVAVIPALRLFLSDLFTVYATVRAREVREAPSKIRDGKA